MEIHHTSNPWTYLEVKVSKSAGRLMLSQTMYYMQVGGITIFLKLACWTFIGVDCISLIRQEIASVWWSFVWINPSDAILYILSSSSSYNKPIGRYFAAQTSDIISPSFLYLPCLFCAINWSQRPKHWIHTSRFTFCACSCVISAWHSGLRSSCSPDPVKR